MENEPVYTAGIDIGSAFSKGVILSDGDMAAFHILPSEGDYGSSSERLMKGLLNKAGISIKDIMHVTSTGYGAAKVSFSNQTANDVTCHGKGIYNLSPSVRTAVDIGAQFTRVFKVDATGGISTFLLSDKCAAGSGRFLQVIARVLQVDLEDIGELSLRSKKVVDFNTGCAVFTETETISRVAEGATVEDILAGIHRMLSAKIDSMLMRLGLEQDLALVGGGARDIGLVRSVKDRMHVDIFVPDEPQIVAALGAALIAYDVVKAPPINRDRGRPRGPQDYF